MNILYTMQQLNEASGLAGRQAQNWVRSGVLLPAKSSEGKGQQNRFEGTEIQLAILLKQLHRASIHGETLLKSSKAIRDVLVYRNAHTPFDGDSTQSSYWGDARRRTNLDDLVRSGNTGGGSTGSYSASKAPPIKNDVRLKEETLLRNCSIAIERTLQGDGPHALGVCWSDAGRTNEGENCVCVPMHKIVESFGYIQGPSFGNSPFAIVNLSGLRKVHRLA